MESPTGWWPVCAVRSRAARCEIAGGIGTTARERRETLFSSNRLNAPNFSVVVNMGGGSGGAMPPEASRFPKDGGRIDLADKNLSRPFFLLQLGAIGECLLSIPGCCFGMPTFHAVGPSLVALLLSGGSILETAPRGAPIAFAAVCLALLAIWCFVQSRRSPKLMQSLHATPALIVSPIVGVALALRLAEADAHALNGALLYLILWDLSIIPVITLKSKAGRRRPVASDPAHVGQAAIQAASRKFLSHIPAMHKGGDPNSSFPSGDVAGAVAFAYPLLRCGASAGGTGFATWLPLAACACVSFSAFGRMYFQAHHLLDVTGGACCALLAGLLFELAATGFAGSNVCAAPRSWWEPSVAFLALAAWAKATKSSGAAPTGRKVE